jgi:hypothetical protein
MIGLAALAAPLSPRGPYFKSVEANPVTATIESSTTTDWVQLLDRDPVAALAIGLHRYRSEVKGFTATLIKHERIGKTLYPIESIAIAVREQPFACLMTWNSGVRNQTQATLYVAGENAGSMRVWRPQALLAKTLTVAPDDAIARSASRYSMTESSLTHGHLRTYLNWKKNQNAGTLHIEHLGRKAIPELDGRICHVMKKTCPTPENDPFLMSEIAKADPQTAFSTVLVYLDAETGYQIGAELRRADGERVGAYFFKHVVLNPIVPPGLFSDSKWK